MYIKVCKGNAIDLNFKIIEYKIPEFEIIGQKNALSFLKKKENN